MAYSSTRPGRRFPFALGLAIFLVQTAIGAILFSIFQQYVPVKLGAGDAWGGYLLAAYGAARFVSETPAGAFTDRVERKLVILVGFALMVPAVAVMSVWQSNAMFLGCAAFLGFGTAFIWPATYAIAADLYAMDERGKVIGFLNLCQLLGFGVGGLAGALLIESAPTAIFGVAIAGIVLAFIVTLLRIPSYRTASLFAHVERGARRRLRDVLSRDMAYVCVIFFGSSITLSGVIPLIRPYGETEVGVSFARLTLALLPAVVVACALYVPAGHLADRAGRTLPLVIGQAMIAFGLVAASMTDSLALVATFAGFIFVGNVLTVPALNAAMMDLAPESHRGAVIGMTVALTGLGLAAGPALGGLVLTTSTPAIGFRLAAVCAICLAAATVARRSAFRPRAPMILNVTARGSAATP